MSEQNTALPILSLFFCVVIVPVVDTVRTFTFFHTIFYVIQFM